MFFCALSSGSTAFHQVQGAARQPGQTSQSDFPGHPRVPVSLPCCWTAKTLSPPLPHEMVTSQEGLVRESGVQSAEQLLELLLEKNRELSLSRDWPPKHRGKNMLQVSEFFSVEFGVCVVEKIVSIVWVTPHAPTLSRTHSVKNRFSTAGRKRNATTSFWE